MTPRDHEPGPSDRAAPVGSDEWRRQTVARLAKQMKAVSMRCRRRRPPMKNGRTGCNPPAVVIEPVSTQRKGIDGGSLQN
jgi:hypothetical protein